MPSVDSVGHLVCLDFAPGNAAAGVCMRLGMETVTHTSWDSLFARDDLHRPGCIIASLSDRSDGELIRKALALHDRWPLSTVFLSERPPTRLVVQALRMGAAEILDWPTDSDRLEQALREADQESTELFQRLNSSQAAAQRLARLRNEERQVLDLMLNGKLNKNIAALLGVALRTVEARRKRIFTKLETRSVAEIALLIEHARNEAMKQPHYALSPYLVPRSSQFGLRE